MKEKEKKECFSVCETLLPASRCCVSALVTNVTSRTEQRLKGDPRCSSATPGNVFIRRNVNQPFKGTTRSGELAEILSAFVYESRSLCLSVSVRVYVCMCVYKVSKYLKFSHYLQAGQRLGKISKRLKNAEIHIYLRWGGNIDQRFDRSKRPRSMKLTLNVEVLFGIFGYIKCVSYSMCVRM